MQRLEVSGAAKGSKQTFSPATLPLELHILRHICVLHIILAVRSVIFLNKINSLLFSIDGVGAFRGTN
jgi:hypothetical protein